MGRLMREPNEIRMSHDGGVMAITLKLSSNGDVGFIRWLDGSFLIARERGKRASSDRLQR